MLTGDNRATAERIAAGVPHAVPSPTPSAA